MLGDLGFASQAIEFRAFGTKKRNYKKFESEVRPVDHRLRLRVKRVAYLHQQRMTA